MSRHDDSSQGADELMLAQLFTDARCSFEELKAKRYVEFPLEFPARWLDEHVERIGGWKLAHPKTARAMAGDAPRR